MNIPMRLMALERIFDLARVHVSDELRDQMNKDYTTLLQTILKLSQCEREKRGKTALLLGGKG
jgi:Asp-tRNA(Asn)/Glu-tRNA(Gln) amidotransferase C subunit